MRVFFRELWHLLLPRRVSRPGTRSVSGSSWRLLAQANAAARIPGVPDWPGPGHLARGRDCFDSRGDAGKREKTQMFHLQWFRTRGVNRGKPGLPGGHGRRLALLGFLIATSLLETGCQSDPCSPCGIIGRTTSRIMSPFRRNCGGCCGSEVVADGGCVSSGVPVGVTAAPIIVPGATVVPGAVTPSTVPAPDSPQYLDQVPQAVPGPAPVRRLPSSTGGTGSTDSTKSSPMNYETFRPDPRSNSSRGDNLAHTLISTPVPAARSAQVSSRIVTRDTSSPLAGDGNSNGESVLDHLPPLDLPSDVTEKTTTPSVAPPAQRKPQSPAPAPPSDHLSGRSSREPDLNLTGTAMPAPEPASSAGGAPGISRFVAVDLKLAAGSAPSAAGLDWLTEKGYKTLVDLRESSEIDLPFIGEATRRGLRYIALPVSLKSIDRAHVARFNFELAMGEARPLYFFDSDGTRAGTLWYIRRVAVDRVNTEIARREAEDLGLNNPDYWSAARSYLERLDNLRSQALDATGPISAADPQKTEEPAPQPVRTTEPADSSTPTPAAPANLSKASSQAQAAIALPETASRPASEPKVQEATDRDLGRSQTLTGPTALAPASSPARSTTPPAPFDTTAWHPFAAIVITGLIFPLGYWSRTVFPTILA